MSVEQIPAFDCRECPKYKTCTALCPDAEQYANQDYKGLGAATFGFTGVREETVTKDFKSMYVTAEEHKANAAYRKKKREEARKAKKWRVGKKRG